MLNKIKNILRIKWLSNKNKSCNENLISLGENNDISKLSINIKPFDKRKKRVTIGNNNLLNATVVFENEKGVLNIGNNTFIGGSTFICVDEISIGDDILISWGCTFMDNNAHSLLSNERANDVKDWIKGIEENKIGYYKDWTKVKHSKITIKNKAWIGFNAIILKGVTIGEGAVIAAGSVITKDVPDYAVVAGNPATILKYTT